MSADTLLDQAAFVLRERQAAYGDAGKAMAAIAARWSLTLGQEMVAAMDTAGGQLDAFVRFVEADPVLVDALRRRDWHAFAGRYNGPGQVDHYAGQIAQAYARHGGE